MQVDLAPELVRQQSALLIEHRHRALVAGGFNREYSHRCPLK
jgi:hypothetical protein